NPPHPMWVHFESMHILQQPTHASKYPPAQGLFLAAGQVLTGTPLAGVWLSLGLAYAALTWMLQGWVPRRWAFRGGAPAALHGNILSTWGSTYLGGAAAMLGGSLLFGALRRFVRQPRSRHAAILAVGLVVLANSRPFEGLAVSLPAAGLLLVWLLRGGSLARGAVPRLLLPVLAVLLPAGAGTAYNNLPVTRKPLDMPYQAPC